MGEYSKEIGERGEEIVEYLFKDLLGYPYYRTNLSIDCSYELDHSIKKGKKRKTHGIDGLVSYKNPLENTVLDIGVISVKYTKDKYPNSPRSKFRDFFKELAWTIQCFGHTDLKSGIESKASDIDKTTITGVLFWLSDNENSKNADLLPEISKSQFEGDELLFDKILFVDNSRLAFIFNVLEILKNKYGRESLDFVYPRTGRNIFPEHNEGFGKYFPMDFFAYDILPIRINTINEGVLFALICRKPFDEDELIQIIGLAKSFNHLEATTKTIIGFPDYNKLSNSDSVNSILMEFVDDSFRSQIEIVNYNLDFRNI
ncbi:MAG: hypothetical protein R2819_12145 [Allomuricauda sp.]